MRKQKTYDDEQKTYDDTKLHQPLHTENAICRMANVTTLLIQQWTIDWTIQNSILEGEKMFGIVWRTKSSCCYRRACVEQKVRPHHLSKCDRIPFKIQVL